jgi:flagellar protein FliS
MTADGYQHYQQNQILTATPSKLLLAAYDGAIRFCRLAGDRMREQDYEGQNTYFNKANAIVSELMSCLKEEVEPQLVSRLRSLYLYVLEKLATANLMNNESDLNEALKILTQLRQTWAEADRILQEQSVLENAA